MVKNKQLLPNSQNIKGIVPDSNLLVLFLVGLYDTNQISQYKRSQMYSVNDYNKLVKILLSYKKIVLNQPIITEACNHLDNLNAQLSSLFYDRIKIELMKYADDSQTTNHILSRDTFVTLGFADSSLEMLSSNYVVLTDDSPLYGQILSKSGKVIFWRQIKDIDF